MADGLYCIVSVSSSILNEPTRFLCHIHQHTHAGKSILIVGPRKVIQFFDERDFFLVLPG